MSAAVLNGQTMTSPLPSQVISLRDGGTRVWVEALCSYRQTYCFGNIMNVDTTGASDKTAGSDKLGYSGVKASNKMAEIDAGRMEKYRSEINKVAAEYGIDPAVIAAIISRESRAGNVLKDGWGDHGNGWGLMQVDKRYHTPRGAWNSEEHISQGTGILVDFVKQVSDKFPSWSAEQQLKGGMAAYNMGLKNVCTYKNLDVGSTGGDYSNDVVARAQWYKTNKGY